MGMFDKDKEIGRELTSTFAEKEQFILRGARIDDKQVETKLGMADKSILTVSEKDSADESFEVTSLGGAIATKVREAETSDFPAVVCWQTVQSKNYGGPAVVLQFVKQA